MQQAIKGLAQLPGFGQRSARRALLHLLVHKDKNFCLCAPANATT
ncbi:MAG: recombination protein RecR, partial [Alphaproteobacteria bacterium]